MKLTTKGRYAVLALTEIALSEDKNLIKISEIAKSQNISSTYLEQILSNLKKNGFVKAVRGPNGGYKLALKAENINGAKSPKIIKAEYKIRSFCFILLIYFKYSLFFASLNLL